jgi:hypothetical protein
MHNDQHIPKDTELQSLPPNQRLPAMLSMIASGKMKTAPKAQTFILQGANVRNKGLYTIEGGSPTPGRIRYNNRRKTERPKGMKLWGIKPANMKIKMVQRFFDKPLLPPKWDWREEAVSRVKQLDATKYFNMIYNQLTK